MINILRFNFVVGEIIFFRNSFIFEWILVLLIFEESNSNIISTFLLIDFN